MTHKVILFKWLATYEKKIRQFYFLAALQGLLYLVIPLSLQGIVTYIMAGSFSASLILLSFIAILATTFSGYLQIWQMRLTETLSQTLFAQISLRFIKIYNQAREWPLQLNRFSEIILLQKSLQKILIDFSFSVISILFGLMLLPLYSNWFLISTLILGLTFAYIIVNHGRKSISTNIDVSNAKYAVWERLQIEADQDKGETQVLEYLSARNKHYAGLEKQFNGIILFKIAFIGFLLFIGAYLVQHGELNIGQFLASEIIIFLVINSIEKLVGSINTFYDMNTSLYKLDDFLKQRGDAGILIKEELPIKVAQTIYKHPYAKKIKQVLIILCLAGIVVLMLPWTQTVNADGAVSTLNPSNRPQTINSRISGRIEKWYITEGKKVKKNDTIAFISEIKDEYVDPQLIERSQRIIQSKETTLESYQSKIRAVDMQIDALEQGMALKLEQTTNKTSQMRLKLSADSAELQAANTQFKISTEQMARYDELVSKGVISKTELEARRVKLQESSAKRTQAENKVQSSIADLRNAELELQTVRQDFQEKLMKAESDKFSVLSLFYEGEGSLTKLQNQLANYEMRQGFYYVLAPQDGYIAKTNFQGLGEIVKEGSALCQIMPEQNEEVAELFVSPMDLPLIQVGKKVQLQFDGWPAFVFSGWPGMSYGTYPAEIVSYDRALSENGKFRILVRNIGPHWPSAIQIGGGVKGMALLNNVPLIYELWRKSNGFPPDFYKPLNKTSKDESKKK